MPDIERLISDNVRESVAFDKAVGKGDAVKKLAAQYLREIMFNKDEGARKTAIDSLQVDVVNHFEGVVTPVAVRQGREQASKLIQQIGGTRPVTDTINDPVARRKALYDLNVSVAQRVQIVQRLINDAGNTLDNRLAAFWLEPGRDDGQKLDALRRLHEQHAAQLAAYEEKMERFNNGEGSRPRRPQLDYLADFTATAVDNTRTQARRVGTDAETAEFQSRGFKSFTWITVNAGDACPDCRRRQGTTGTMDYFNRIGKPGAGATVCGARCFCLLVPKETVYHAPGLARGVTVGAPPDPVTPTDPTITAQIAAQKVTPPAAPAPPSKSPKERLQTALDADGESRAVAAKVEKIGEKHSKRLKAAEKTFAAEMGKINDYNSEWVKSYDVADDEGDRIRTVLDGKLADASRKVEAARKIIRETADKQRAEAHRAIAVPAAERFAKMKTPIVADDVTKAPAVAKSATTRLNVETGAEFVRTVWKRPQEFTPFIGGIFKPEASVHTVPVAEHGPNYRANQNISNKGTTPDTNVMNVPENVPVRTVVHELGHEVETRHTQGHELAKTFLDARTEGQAVRKLKDVLPHYNYGDNEKGQDDGFGPAFGADSAWYVGKRYDYNATEIVSMGMELLYANPTKFAAADPTYFRFILGFLRGTLSI